MKIYLVGLLAACAAGPVIGQAASPVHSSSLVPTQQVAPAQTVSPTQTVAVIQTDMSRNVLRASTEIPFITREDLTTKKKQLRVGQRVQLEVSSNVEANGVVVIPAGTPAVAELTEVRNKGMWGKSGYIAARIISLRLGDRNIRLSGTFDDKGVTGTAAVVGAVLLVPLVGFFATGTSAQIPTGSAVKGFLEEDISFKPVAMQPQIIEVPVSAPMATSPATVAAPAPVSSTVPAKSN